MPTTFVLNSPAVRLPGGETSATMSERVIRKVLRVPLLAKLIGANVAMVMAALIAIYFAQTSGASSRSFAAILVLALVAGSAVNFVLTHTALRPIRDIEGTIRRMWRGDTDSRVASSAVADPELDRIGYTLNSLLDRLSEDRDAMRQLAADVVIAEDREQRRIAVQLHESIAQSLASITFMLTALAAKSSDGAIASRIMEIRGVVGDVLDEVDVLSHTIHPRVLNDLGLTAGLRALAFDVSRQDVPVAVHVSGCQDEDLRDLGPETASALFRIAQEAVQNALRHSAADRVDITISVADNNLALRISDDGKGFDVEQALSARPNKGLVRMRQRASLINARLRIDSSARDGTSVEVTMPLGSTTFPA